MTTQLTSVILFYSFTLYLPSLIPVYILFFCRFCFKLEKNTILQIFNIQTSSLTFLWIVQDKYLKFLCTEQHNGFQFHCHRTECGINSGTTYILSLNVLMNNSYIRSNQILVHIPSFVFLSFLSILLACMHPNPLVWVCVHMCVSFLCVHVHTCTFCCLQDLLVSHTPQTMSQAGTRHQQKSQLVLSTYLLPSDS